MTTREDDDDIPPLEEEGKDVGERSDYMTAMEILGSSHLLPPRFPIRTHEPLAGGELETFEPREGGWAAIYVKAHLPKEESGDADVSPTPDIVPRTRQERSDFGTRLYEEIKRVRLDMFLEDE